MVSKNSFFQRSQKLIACSGERLKPGDKEALSGNLCFLDLLEGLCRISNHLSTAAYGFKPTGLRTRKARVKPAQKDLPIMEVPHPPTQENPQTP